MAGGIANVASGVVTIDALLGNFKWNSPNLTYNFPDAASYYNASHLLHRRSAPSSPTHTTSQAFAPVTPSLQGAITHAITTQLTAVAPLNYTLVAPGADRKLELCQSRSFSVDAELGVPPGGVGFYPGGIQRGGDAWFNVNQARFNDVDQSATAPIG